MTRVKTLLVLGLFVAGVTALVVAVLVQALGDQESDASVSVQPSLVAQSRPTTYAGSAELFPAVRVSENGDLELSIRFHRPNNGVEADREVVGHITASRIEPGKCFQSKGAIRRYTDGRGYSNAYVSVIACIEDDGRIRIGLRGRRTNEYGDQGDRYILAGVPAERQRSGPWFVSPKGKTFHALISRRLYRPPPARSRTSSIESCRSYTARNPNAYPVENLNIGNFTYRMSDGGRCTDN